MIIFSWMQDVQNVKRLRFLTIEITKVKCPHCSFWGRLRNLLGDYEREGTEYVCGLYSRQTRFLANKLQRLISSLVIFFECLANFKITISDTKGKSITRELKDNDANPLIGLLIGQETDASLVGLEGKIKITGGSDKSGIPMRADLLSSARKRILIPKGVGSQQTKKVCENESC